jgi:enoyl-[acyl-carrier protein] reductase I
MLPAFDLNGKKGLVVGIANMASIATGCAHAFRAAGAELAVTYVNAKAEPHVRPIADALGVDPALCLPCDVREAGQLEAVFAALHQHWGRLDFLLHAIAYCPKSDLQGRVVDCSAEGFHIAMGVSCYSFIQMVKLAEPLMTDGGCLLTTSFYGSEKAVENYNIMGPVKAALESCVRAMAAELGAQRIRVHALSPGPIATRAASGISRFDAMLEAAAARAPQHHLVSIDDVGACAAFLVSPAAAAMTGSVHYIDGGYHIIG